MASQESADLHDHQICYRSGHQSLEAKCIVGKPCSGLLLHNQRGHCIKWRPPLRSPGRVLPASYESVLVGSLDVSFDGGGDDGDGVMTMVITPVMAMVVIM